MSSAESSAPWWKGAVIYQIYPRSFRDSSGDGVGDLRGITSSLAHVAGLGADAVWLSPFFRSPMKDFGYDVSDYCDVDPLFGTLEDFDALIEEADRLGLKILIDQVLSHSSDRHPWFQESRQDRHNSKADWYVWADPRPDGTPPNNWLSIFGGPAWTWDPRRSQYYLHNFLRSQPDLNWHHPEVQRAGLAVMEFWLQRGVAGFRFDTANFYLHDPELRDNPALPRPEDSLVPLSNPYSYQLHRYDKNHPDNPQVLEAMRGVLDRHDAIALGEIGASADRSMELMEEYTAPGRFQLCYTFDLFGAELSPESLRAKIMRQEEEAPSAWPCWALSNHDVIRHLSRLAPDGADAETQRAVARLCAALLISLRGSLCLYQGEELGLPEAELELDQLVDPYGIEFWPEFKGRDGCRTPMPWQADTESAGFSRGSPWLPVPAEHHSLAVDQQQGVTGSVLETYRELLALRRDHPALRLGALAIQEPSSALLAIQRTHGGEQLVMLLNVGSQPEPWPEALRSWRRIWSSEASSPEQTGSALEPWGARLLGAP